MYKIGFGNDIHKLEEGKPLILGGIKIPSDVGAVGHSDSDALFHAITDSILGALAIGDIGSHFSNEDDKWKDANSKIFLREAVRLMSEKCFRIENLDSIISLEKPRIRVYASLMRKNIAQELNVNLDCVNVKAKTGEGLDSVGKNQAVKAEACILLKEVIIEN